MDLYYVVSVYVRCSPVPSELCLRVSVEIMCGCYGSLIVVRLVSGIWPFSASSVVHKALFETDLPVVCG